MHVARVISVLEPGGAQLSVLRVSLALRRRGVTTEVLAGSATPEGLELFRRHGMEARVWGLDRRLQYSCNEQWAGWLGPRLRHADLVHAHMFGAWWAAARAVPAAIPLVASEHNSLQWPGQPRLREMRAALRRVDLFFAHGPDARESVLAAGLPAERMRAGASPIGELASGIDPDLPTPRIVYSGRLHREKGPDLLVEAIARLADPPATLVLGSGPLEQQLRAQVRAHALERAVQMLGWQREPGRFLAGASACVVPSRHDASSQTAMLAMAHGVPVIGTAVEGLPALLGGGRGVLVRPDDPAALAQAIAGVLAGRFRPRLEAARAYARQFTPESVADVYHDAYQALVGVSSRGRLGSGTFARPPGS